MPEQQSQRAGPVTAAPIEAPFETQLVRLGVEGLNLNDELDLLKPGQCTRLTNADHDANGTMQARAGQTSFATAGGTHHSVRKLRDPQAGSTTRVWGVGSSLFVGASGGLSNIDGGYSGDPLALVPHRPPLSGDSWMFVGDRLRMRKTRADGLDLPIGLPAPGAAAAVALGTEYRTSIAEFEASDGTQASAWTGNAGRDEDGNPSGIPITEDSTVTPLGIGSAVRFRTTVENASGVYDNFWCLSLSRDLSQLTPVGGGGAIAASDDDFIHFWSFLSLPHLIQELRIYFVISAVFDSTVLPGTSTSGANGDAYVKSIRQDDFAQFIRGQLSQIDAAETARVRALRDQDLKDRTFKNSEGDRDIRASWAELRAVTDPMRRLSLQTSSGSYQWVEHGVVGVPLRRGDFARIGVSTGRNWSTVTGLVVYVRMAQDLVDRVGVIGLDEMYLTGGRGPDTADPGQQQYDYRYTHYDTRTGAEGNGSPEMAAANKIDSLRRAISVTPGAFGDGAVRQRVYRRGGTLIDNWFFAGTNSSDGGVFTDTNTDDAISAAGTLPINHFQPVPTVDENGTTVLAQPVPALWGPVEGMLFACGDPYRPGHVYHCVPDQPDHWPSDGLTEVCPPSEELMNGGLLGHQAFVLSRLRLYMLYPNLTGTGTVTSAPTLCKRGLWSRWGMAIGPKGVYFVSEDGIFVSSGGPEEWISRDLDPLFRGETRHGYLPINKNDTAAIRLTVWENKLYFQYADTNGNRQVMVYSLLHEFWRHYDFGVDPTNLQGEDEEILLVGAANATYQHSGTTDAGAAISVTARTGAFTGGVRAEKIFGDMIVDADRGSASAIVLTNYLNEEAVTNPASQITGGTGRQRYVFDAFGTAPQKARSISTEISWSATGTSPLIYQIGYGTALQPEITNNRVTQWDDLGHPDEKWLSGVTFDVDTGAIDRTIIIERSFGGVLSTVDTLTVNTNGRHKVTFSWASVPAQLVRIRPSDDCKFWLLYRADWIWQAEPPRISKWDVHFENQWDQYYTGLDLYCDTGGLEKRIEIFVDEQQLTNSLGGGLTYWPVTANGRRVVHLTLPWGRGHVFHFRAIDANSGLLYSHRWHLQEEPSEQANWNQNFSVYGTRADKWLKAIIFECDTFGQNKSVQVEVDGTTVETLTVNTNGRRVIQRALADQKLGRVWRMFPVDGNPGRLYSAQPIFDEEPFALRRWETQETNHSLPGWFYPIYGYITHKSTADLLLTVSLQINQKGDTVTETYVIPHSGGRKIRHYQSFRTSKGGKGVLVKYLITSTADVYLYREETSIYVQPWGAAEPIIVQPFGSDDLDPTRPMRHAVLAATQSGGSLGD